MSADIEALANRGRDPVEGVVLICAFEARLALVLVLDFPAGRNGIVGGGLLGRGQAVQHGNGPSHQATEGDAT
jgi:hypothetical protein